MNEERRQKFRRRCLLGARVIFNNRRSTVTCTVKNLSGTGALLNFGEMINIPDDIEILLDKRSTLAAATVVWRSERNLGIAFAHDQTSADFAERLLGMIPMSLPPSGTVLH
jgi:PilZ domain